MARPIEFDRAEALDAAMHLFWRQGVRRASLAELTAVMRLSRSSFYNSFGTKQKLLEEVVDRYSAAQAAKLAEATGKASLRTALQRIFAAIARDNNLGRGCLLGNCAAEFGSRTPAIARCVRRGIAAQAGVLADRIAQAQAAGEIDAGREARELAYFIAATIMGLRVLAKTGVPAGTIVTAGNVALSSVFAETATLRRRSPSARKSRRQAGL